MAEMWCTAWYWRYGEAFQRYSRETAAQSSGPSRREASAADQMTWPL
jgi:hypothetical protein